MKRIIKYLLLLAFAIIIPYHVSAYESDEITLYLFHGDGCPHCAEELKYLETIEGKYENFKIVKYEVWYDKNNANLLKQVESAFKITRSGVPTNVIGNTVISGYGTSTGSKIERAIEYYRKNEYTDVVAQIKDGTYKEETKPVDDGFEEEEKIVEKAVTIDVPLFGKVNLKKVSLMTAAVIIGLVDGFNPCAMWILLFLISILIGMKNRKRMWVLGLTFLITSALVYMFIMLSWITVAVKMTTIVWIRDIIAIIALIGGLINLNSYIKTRKETGCDVVDDKKRKKIITKIKKFTSEKSFILALLGVIGLAISVNLVELACSAGLPIVFTELIIINGVGKGMRFVYTLVYIFFFLIDDLIVFFIAMFTMKVAGISTKYNKYSHLIGGIIMLLVGLLLIFKPEWLMFNFK